MRGEKEEEEIGGEGEMWDRLGERQREKKRKMRGRSENESSSLVWVGRLRYL